MFFCVFSVLTIFKLRINAIIFITFILCTFLLFFFFLIYVINFIFLINCRFKNVCLTFILIFVCATNNELYIILTYMFVSYVFFLIFLLFLVNFSSFFLIRKLY